MTLALAETDVDEILSMLSYLDCWCDPENFDLSRTLCRHHCRKLIPVERYRMILNGDREMMWQHLDDLVAGAGDGMMAG